MSNNPRSFIDGCEYIPMPWLTKRSEDQHQSDHLAEQAQAANVARNNAKKARQLADSLQQRLFERAKHIDKLNAALYEANALIQRKHERIRELEAAQKAQTQAYRAALSEINKMSTFFLTSSASEKSTGKIKTALATARIGLRQAIRTSDEALK
jgi:hypothetical protein